jgi:ACT domain-containing protein
MAELKTQVNKASVAKFLSNIKDIEKRKDCLVISEIMEKATKSKPEM